MQVTVPNVNIQRQAMAPALADMVDRRLDEWDAAGHSARLWRRDASLWTGADESCWLDWLTVVDEERPRAGELRAFADEIRADGFTHALLLGMGGSSLGPEVLRLVFGRLPGAPDLHVLDSTDPAQVQAVERRVDLARTLVIVASKSGTTLEPNAFKQYFFDRVDQAVGRARAGRQFVAITDPGSKLEQVASADGFRRIFHGWPRIGGRYSALSRFGLVPAAVMRLDLERLLGEAAAMFDACGPKVAARANPGVVLGTVLGVLATEGRNKLTLLASPRVAPLGAWLEQLVAESTGKNGQAIIPVDQEPLLAPARYGEDRLFVHLQLAGDDHAGAELANALERIGHPVVHIELADEYGLAQEFARWEVATAVAGAHMTINPFDQPDVEASKLKTRALTTEYESRGALPAESPLLREGGLTLYADAANARALERGAGERSLPSLLSCHLKRVGPGDYFALLAYVEMHEPHTEVLQAIREMVLRRTGAATCLGFGPRFLHSTGQAYKGGPNSGVFLQITCDDQVDLPVPGQSYTFGVIKAAQARGDLDVLNERGRRALRVHLGPNVRAGLESLRAVLAQALE
jgi:transaldolase / glucose-6-phosphate isomerase